jgi:hypothetical protein
VTRSRTCVERPPPLPTPARSRPTSTGRSKHQWRPALRVKAVGTPRDLGRYAKRMGNVRPYSDQLGHARAVYCKVPNLQKDRSLGIAIVRKN